ncbi:hypothetical protein HDU67_008123 [Dinochytrium kinnereticum]|nr:hypothetical protein HDU67_008123 [Dinochytrium kinnereticum]
MDAVDVKNLLLRLQSVAGMDDVLKLDRDTIHRELKQPFPGLSPALRDWVQLVMKRDLLVPSPPPLSANNNPSSLNGPTKPGNAVPADQAPMDRERIEEEEVDAGEEDDSKDDVPGVSQTRRQLEVLMSDVIDVILLPKEGSGTSFRSPGEAAISPELLHYQVRPTWIKDLNVLVENWIKQPSWRASKTVLNADGEMTSLGGGPPHIMDGLPKPLLVDDLMGDEDNDDVIVPALDGVIHDKEAGELCECCSKVKDHHHTTRAGFPPIAKSLKKETSNRFSFPNDKIQLLLSLNECFQAARQPGPNNMPAVATVPTKLEVDVKAYNEKLRRLASIQAALRKSKVETAWYCTRGVMAALDTVDHDRNLCVGVPTLGRALKVLMSQFKSFEELWSEGTEKFTKSKKKKSVDIDEATAVAELDALWDRFISELRESILKFREQIVNPALEKVNAVVGNLQSDLNAALGKVETSALALGLSVEEQKRVKDCVEPGRHGLGVVTKMVRKCVDAYETALDSREEALFEGLIALDAAYKEESARTVRGRLEKASNREFRKRIKDMENEFSRARVHVVSEMAGSVCPLSPIAVIGAVVLQASLGLGNLLDKVAHYESADLIDRAMKKEGLPEDRQRLILAFADGVRRGRAELSRVVGMCLVKEARRRLDEMRLDLKLGQFDERIKASANGDGDEGSKKKKGKKKKSKGKLVGANGGADEAEEEDGVIERPSSVLSDASRHPAESSTASTAVDADGSIDQKAEDRPVSIAPAHSPESKPVKVEASTTPQIPKSKISTTSLLKDAEPVPETITTVGLKATTPTSTLAPVKTASPASTPVSQKKGKASKKELKRATLFKNASNSSNLPTPPVQATPIPADDEGHLSMPEPVLPITTMPVVTAHNDSVSQSDATEVGPNTDHPPSSPDSSTHLDAIVASLKAQITSLEAQLQAQVEELKLAREENQLLQQQTGRAAEEAERWRSVAMSLQSVARPPSLAPGPPGIAGPVFPPSFPGVVLGGLPTQGNGNPLFSASFDGGNASQNAPIWNPLVTASSLWAGPGGGMENGDAPTGLGANGAAVSSAAFANVPHTPSTTMSSLRMAGLPSSLDSIWAPPQPSLTLSPSASPMPSASVALSSLVPSSQMATPPPGLVGGGPPGIPSRTLSSSSLNHQRSTSSPVPEDHHHHPHHSFAAAAASDGNEPWRRRGSPHTSGQVDEGYQRNGYGGRGGAVGSGKRMYGRFGGAPNGFGKSAAGLRCGNCGDTGHESGGCQEGCRYCDKKDHLSDTCPNFD